MNRSKSTKRVHRSSSTHRSSNTSQTKRPSSTLSSIGVTSVRSSFNAGFHTSYDRPTRSITSRAHRPGATSVASRRALSSTSSRETDSLPSFTRSAPSNTISIIQHSGQTARQPPTVAASHKKASITPFMTQKRTNYTFSEITGPSDTRYLGDNEDWVPERAQLFDNTFVHAGIILERPPIIVPKQPQWEVDWYLYREAKMSERALVLPPDLGKGMYGKQTIANREDYPEPLPCVTQDDVNNDRRSLYRALDEPLYLITKVQQDFDSSLPEEIWTFPVTEVRESETIRTAAERTLFYHAGDLNYYTMSNAPIVHHEQPVTDFIKKEYPDASKFKSFYMHSIYLGGNVELEPGGEITDFAWVKQSELHEYFTSKYTEELLKLTGSSLYYLRPE